MTRIVVERSIEINAPVSKVWEIIVSPDTWTRWMLVVPEMERAGGLCLGSQVWWKDKKGKAYLAGTVAVFEPHRRFVLELQDSSWPRPAEPGEVTYAFLLAEASGRTRLEFTLGDLSIDAEAQQWHDAYHQSRELEIIKEMAET
jgi:uncharacterized protein YndB with AHSA1/START domain